MVGEVSRVTIAYDVDLTESGDVRALALPVPADAAASAVTVQIRVPAGSDRTIRTAPDTALERTDRLATARFSDVAGETLLVAEESAGAEALVGEDPAVGPHFATTVAPDLPEVEGAGRRRAVFLLDVSMSSNPDRMNVWLDLLRFFDGVLSIDCRDDLKTGKLQAKDDQLADVFFIFGYQDFCHFSLASSSLW